MTSVFEVFSTITSILFIPLLIAFCFMFKWVNSLYDKKNSLDTLNYTLSNDNKSLSMKVENKESKIQELYNEIKSLQKDIVNYKTSDSAQAFRSLRAQLTLALKETQDYKNIITSIQPIEESFKNANL